MNTVVGHRRRGIIGLLILDYWVMFIARTGISMCGPALMHQFGWSATQFGWVSTAFFIGYAITMLPAGALADRFGGGFILLAGTLWWSIFTFLTPFGSTLGLMMALRILVGVGQGLLVPANFSLLANWIPKNESGKATGLLQIGCPAGIAVSMLLAAAIIQRWGWPAVFYSFALLGPLWCLIWWRWGNNRPESDTRIGPAELHYIQAGQEGKHPTGSDSELSKKDIFSTPAVWACALGYFCTNYLFFLFMTWLPTYFAMGRGIDLKQSAIFSMLPYLVAIPAYPLGGVVADYASAHFGQNVGRKISPIAGLLLAGLFLVLGTRAGSLWTGGGLICASNFFLCFTMASHFSIPMVFSQKNTGVIVGLNGMFGTVAGIFAPVFSGLIIDLSGHYEYALYLGAGIAIVGASILSLAQIKPIEKKWRSDDDIALHS